MKKIIGIVIVMILIAALTGTAAFAEMGCDAKCQLDSRHKDKMEAVAKELGLTAGQEKALKESKEAFRAQVQGLRAQLKEKRQALKAELSKPGVTRQQVEPIVAEMKALQSRMVDQRIDGIFKIKEILTPEQFTKLQAMKGKREHSGKIGRDRN